MTNQRHPGESQQGLVRQFLVPLVVTLVSVAMVLGGFLLVWLDTAPMSPMPTQVLVQRPSVTPFLPTLTQQPPATPVATFVSPLSPPEGQTAEPEISVEPPMGTLAPTAPWTPVPPRTGAPTAAPTCAQPPGWFIYTVREGDTLTGLARLSGVTTWTLMRSNCLETTVLYAGQRLYVPPSFYTPPTPQPSPCGPPSNWVVYTVQPQETLYSLSIRFGVDIEVLRRANCLRSYTIYAGQVLYVPPGPWPTATSTPSVSPTPTEQTTATSTPPSVTPSPTLPHATATPSPSATQAPEPSGSPSPSPTPSSTGTPTATGTSTVTATPTATWTPTVTSTAHPNS